MARNICCSFSFFFVWNHCDLVKSFFFGFPSHTVSSAAPLTARVTSEMFCTHGPRRPASRLLNLNERFIQCIDYIGDSVH